MSLQFDGNGLVTLGGGGFTLRSSDAFLVVIEGIEYTGNGKMFAGNSTVSNPYFAWFNGGLDVRLGANTRVDGAYTLGQKYRVEISCDGANQITVNVPGIGSSTGVINQEVVIDILGAYAGGALPYDGIAEFKMKVTGVPEGSLEYDFESPAGGSTLVENLQGLDGTLSGFTTGGFGTPQTAGDTTPPVITLTGDNPLSLVEGTPYTEPGFTATDDTDGDITANVVVGGDTVDENAQGAYNITYNVSDSSSNAAAQVVRTVNVVAADATPPTITLLGDNPLSLVEGTPYTEPGFTAADNVDGDITANVIVGGDTVDENVQGAYNITYNVSDSSGNAATQQARTVNVVAAPSEVITITSIVEGEARKADINSQATFTIAGTITGATGPVEYSLDGVTFQTLDAGAASTFTGNVVVTKQQDVTVRLASNVAVTDVVRYVTAADIVIVEGPSQSNGAGSLDNFQMPTWVPAQPRPVMYKAGENFSLLVDPTSNHVASPGGSMWPLIAKKYADLGLTVCIGNVAVGGTTVGGSWSTVGQHYSRIVEFANATGGLSFATTCIGESDTAWGTTKADYKARYLEATDKLNLDYGIDVYATFFPIGTTLTNDPNLQNIRDAIQEMINENTYIKFGGDLGVIDLTGQADGLHIKSDEDAAQAAQIRFNAFQGIASSATIQMAGVPDGDHEVIYWSLPIADINVPLGVATVTATGGEFTIPTTLQPGAEIIGLIPGTTPPSTGGAIYGVTV